MRDCDSDQKKMWCSSCGATEEFRKNPHHTGARYCPNSPHNKPEQTEPKSGGAQKKSSLRRIQHEGEGDSTDGGEGYETDNDDVDERANSWSDGRRSNMFYVGLSTREFDRTTRREATIMRRQSRMVVVFKHEFEKEHIFSAVVGEADTGVQFSLISIALAEDCDMNYTSYRCGYENNAMRLHDFGGEPVPICGFIDLQVNNATAKEHEYRWTRLLIVGGEFRGEERILIIGRNDLKLLEVIGNNFPMRMTEASVNLETKARAETLLKDMEEMGRRAEEVSEADLTESDQPHMAVADDNEPDEMEVEEDVEDDADDLVDDLWESPSKPAEDLAAELHAEEEHTAMKKEEDNMLLLYSIGRNSRGWGHAPSTYIPGLNKSTRMMRAEMAKRNMFKNMREAILFYGGQHLFYVKRVLHWDDAELLDWVVRENERTANFPNNTDDEVWSAMLGCYGWGNGLEFCCRVARLEDRACQLCRHDVATRVRRAVSKERRAAAGRNAREASSLPARSAVEISVRQEAAELVKRGSDCLKVMKRAGQSHVSSSEKDITAKTLSDVRNLSEKVQEKEAEREREQELRIKRREKQIRQQLKELHIATREFKEFEARAAKEKELEASEPAAPHGRIREQRAKEGGVGDGESGNQLRLAFNHESGVDSRVDVAGERGDGLVADADGLGDAEVPKSPRLFQTVEEGFDSLPELCDSSDAANSDDDLPCVTADESGPENDDGTTSSHAMVEFTADDGMEDPVDPATIPTRVAEDEAHGNGTDGAGDNEGGVRGRDGGGELIAPGPEGVGRPLGWRAVASSFF